MKLLQRAGYMFLLPFMLIMGIFCIKPGSRYIRNLFKPPEGPDEISAVWPLMCTNCANISDIQPVLMPTWDHMGYPYLIIAVTSSYERLEYRKAIRQSWGNVTIYKGLDVRTVFVFGISNSKQGNEAIMLEHNKYGDILQGNFNDTYQHLTEKTMVMLQWFSDYYVDAKYLLKADDNTFIHPHRVMDDLLLRGTCNNFVGGSCFFSAPSRDPTSKYYIPTKHYNLEFYPQFCAGPSYIVTQSAAKMLIQATRSIKYVFLEDVFFTGLCRAFAGVHIVNIDGFLVGAEKTSACDLQTWAKTTHDVAPNAHKSIWFRAMSTGQHHCSWKLPEMMMITLVLMTLVVCIVVVAWLPYHYLKSIKS